MESAVKINGPARANECIVDTPVDHRARVNASSLAGLRTGVGAFGLRIFFVGDRLN